MRHETTPNLRKSSQIGDKKIAEKISEKLKIKGWEKLSIGLKFDGKNHKKCGMKRLQTSGNPVKSARKKLQNFAAVNLVPIGFCPKLEQEK